MRTIENPNIFRKNIIEKINLLIKNETKSTNLEKAIFNYSVKEAGQRKVVKKWDNPFFVELYTNRLRSIYINISNPELLEQIVTGQLKAKDVAFSTHQEMNPKKWDSLIQAKMKKDKTKYETNMEAATDTFKCRKCHQNKCTYYQLQTRSADEPMTTFVNCLECGNRWRC